MLIPIFFLIALFIEVLSVINGGNTNGADGLSSTHESKVPVEIQTPKGRLRGFESIFLHKRVRSFLGVPFAEPPLGEFRFRPPVTKKPWNGTFDASTLSPACYQGRDTYNESFWGSEMWNHNTPISENCLYMNIWAPAEAKNLTVMVWLFGGGFYYGSNSLILYDGKALALTANVIVVNINYRVGPFGYLFLDHPEIPGNMGMLDQQLALYWIRENIEAFGGNPFSISLFGESAGASSIVAHLIAPGSNGLFQNGILQSGSLDNKWSMDTPKHALHKSRKFAELVDCNRTDITDTIRCLKQKPASEFLDQLWNVDLSFLEFPLVIVSRDENFFRTEDAFVALRKRKFRRDVNLMIGINHDEGNFWNIYNMPKFFDVNEQPLLTLEDFNECVSTAFARLPETIRHAASYVYLNAEGNKCQYTTGKHKFLAEQINQMVGDYFFTCDSLWLADQMDDAGKVFIYYFDQQSTANPWPSWTGVMHGYEIEFVFGAPIYNTSANYTSRERVLSQKMIQYWSSFAKTGVPTLRTNKEIDEWPQYHSLNNRRWMQLKGGSHVKPIPAIKEKECQVWRTARDMEYNEYVHPETSATAPIAPFYFATAFIYLFSLLISIYNA
ncbi:carboxylesterase family domain-containing protein [Ditylenchus destructor]|uniref:Carboxylic ester hydrolase n=1 Tax=Ditylenchus destructor TaxID=166010 RepID=A0AAD4MZN3_9BILA|nr:carboxylesterase family domain-containing protein [Ditylenchus destructor]